MTMKKSINKKMSKLISKEAGGNIAGDILPLLLTIIFCCTVALMITDYFSCAQTKENINVYMQECVYDCNKEGYVSDDVKTAIKSYLSNEYGCEVASIDFTGTTNSPVARGSNIILCVKCYIPHKSNIFKTVSPTYESSFKVNSISLHNKIY